MVPATALLVLLFLVAGALLLPGPAFAEDPFRLSTQIEDKAGALGDQEGDVQMALGLLQDEQQVQLWVVFVDTFSGMTAEDWAYETASISDLGLNDALLAVAVEDRAYAYSVDTDFPLSATEMNDIMISSVEPALSENDWAAAAIAAASGMRAELAAPATTETTAGSTGTTAAPVTTTASSGRWSSDVGRCPLGAHRHPDRARARRGADRGRHSAGQEREGRRGTARGGAQSPVSIKELRQRVGSQLVTTDDAVKTSTEEVGFAAAEFGDEQAAPFQKAVDEAKAELDEAFRLYRQYDEHADEQSQRQLLGGALKHVSAANQALDGQVERFDKLRDLEKQAPQVFAGLDQRLTALEGRIPEARQELARLTSIYAPAALSSVAANPDDAASRIAFSREQVKAGREDLATNQAGEAAVGALAAQEAAAQAQALLDAVGRIGKDLAEVGGKIDAAIAETKRDITEARAAGGAALCGAAAQQLPGLVDTAEAAMNAAAQAAGPEGGRDPLGALKHLVEADGTLEGALVSVRDEQAQRAKAAAALERGLIAARSQIAAADGYITTHRGAVGSEARSLLSEARSYLDQAVAAQKADPFTAGKHASVAYELASRALLEAQRDTERIIPPGVGSALGGAGPLIAGAILGGILSSALGGGRGGDLGGAIGGALRGGLGGSIGGWRAAQRRLRRRYQWRWKPDGARGQLRSARRSVAPARACAVAVAGVSRRVAVAYEWMQSEVVCLVRVVGKEMRKELQWHSSPS